MQRISSLEEEEEKKIDQEEANREIAMEFGGKEYTDGDKGRQTTGNGGGVGLSTYDDDEEEDRTTPQGDEDQDKEMNMRDIAIMHMAKKNLSFELEYI